MILKSDDGGACSSICSSNYQFLLGMIFRVAGNLVISVKWSDKGVTRLHFW